MPKLLDLAGPCLVLLTAACGGREDSTGTKPEPPQPQICDPHAVTGSARFTDRSEAWGLSTQDAQAWVLTSMDLNGDGYQDLLGHVPVGAKRGTPTEKYYSVLINEPKPGGGRHFVDRTLESGYGTTRDGAPGELRVATGAVFGDVDNDGDVDVLSLTGASTPNDPPTAADSDRTELLLNDGEGKLTLAPNAGVSFDPPRPVWSATLTDFDLDGRLDAFFANWLTALGYTSEQQLLLGDGQGAFTDVSGEAGLTDAAAMRGACGVTACDVDDDGMPEILVSTYGRSPNMLLKNAGGNSYVDHAVAAGFAYDQNFDYHDDQSFLCYCAANPSAPDCGNAQPPKVTSCAALPKWVPGYSDQPERLGGNTFTTVCSDITGDGKLDLYNAEIQHWWAGQASDPSALLVNKGDMTFDRPSRDQTGMHWEHVGASWDEGGIDAAAGDLNNDGREEVVIGRSDYFDQYAMIFWQLPDGRFEEAAKARGIDHPCAASPILADFDRDGDLDVVMGSSRMREWCAKAWAWNEIRFYENDASQHGAWIAVRLVGDGVTANRSAIGAKVVVEAGGARFTKVVQGAYGHGASQPDSVLFFGLGACTSVDAIEVRWPDQARTVERWEKVQAGRVVELVMGDPVVRDALPTNR